MNVASLAARAVYRPQVSMLRRLLAVSIACAAITVAGLFAEPSLAWPNLHLANYYLMGLGLAGIFFVALQHVTNAAWSVAVRRIPEAMTSVLPVSAGVLFATFLGVEALYEWSRGAHDPVLAAKEGWLNVPFFTARSVVYVAVWIALAIAIVRTSRAQDVAADLALTRRSRKLSAIYIVVFGLTFTLASIDWVMSLEPHWYSTIFGIYNFSGLFLNGLATMTLVVIMLRRAGPLAKIVTDNHLHDLGKLVFAFSTFWMYIWFSQYMLTWYANIPEEARYYVTRSEGGWEFFTWLNVAFNWAVPFVVLLPSWTKKHEGVLMKVCIVVMIGHWVDLAWMMLPPFSPHDIGVSLWTVAPIASAVTLFFYMTLRSLGRHNLVPTKDPYLEEGLSQGY